MIRNIFLSVSVLALSALAHGQNAPTPALNDAQIAKVLITINEGEIDAAELAKKNGRNEKVVSFAKTMIDEHKKNRDETKDVAKKNDIDTKSSELADTLKKDLKTANKDLKAAKKGNFDKAYADSQVAMHEKALSTLTQTLIPAATHPALKEHLMKTQAAVSMHLEHAKQLQAEIK